MESEDVLLENVEDQSMDLIADNIREDILSLSESEVEADDNITVIINDVKQQRGSVFNRLGERSDGASSIGATSTPNVGERDQPTTGKRKKRNVCGAEKNRRRKAKLALSGQDPKPQTSDSTGQGGSKRIRSPNTSEKATPPPKRMMEQTPLANRPKDATTFKDVLSDSLTHYIIGSKGDLTVDQVEAVMGNIIWELEQFIGSGSRAPGFNGKKLGEVELELRCADDNSVKWLKHIVPKLNPWKNAALRLVTKSEWETICKPKRMVRMNVLVPWCTTSSYFMDVLRSNNPELRTKYWEIKNVQSWSDSTKFHLKIDETSVELLKAKGFKAHWLLDVVEFKFARNGPPTAEAESSSQKGKNQTTGTTATEASATVTEAKDSTNGRTDNTNTSTVLSALSSLVPPAVFGAGTGEANSDNRTGPARTCSGNSVVPQSGKKASKKAVSPAETAN